MNTFWLIAKKYGGWLIAALVLCIGGYVVAKTIAHAAIVAKERDDALAENARLALVRDSVLAFASARQAEVDSANSRAAASAAKGAVIQARLSRTLAALEAAEHRPIPIDASASDSAAAYRERYQQARAALDVSVALTATKDAEIANLKTAHAALQASVSRLTTQVAAEQANAANLADVLKKMQPPCRLGFLPCPSRTVAFIGGITLGALVVVSVR